jgi:hypothetical protein
MSELTTEPSPPSVAELEERLRKLEALLVEGNEPDTDVLVERVIAKLATLAETRPAVGERVLVVDAAPGPPPPPGGAVLRSPEPTPAEPLRRRWLLPQIGSELRLILQMYFDPRYRISRTMQIALPGIVLMLVFNYFFFSVWVSITFFSPVLERALALVLGVLGYKVLTREMARYREVLDYLARYGQ